MILKTDALIKSRGRGTQSPHVSQGEMNMLYFITIVNNQEIERPWHVDEPVIQFKLEDLDEVYADGHELLYILNNINDVSRPKVDARSHTWTDKDARHIHAVLTKKFGNTKTTLNF